MKILIEFLELTTLVIGSVLLAGAAMLAVCEILKAMIIRRRHKGDRP